MKSKKLTTPDFQEDDCWWELYPRLKGNRFYLGASGYDQGIPCPYQSCKDKPGLEPSPHLPYTTFVKGWKVVGYTLTPIWQQLYRPNWVAIMFEHKEGRRVWFHFPK